MVSKRNRTIHSNGNRLRIPLDFPKSAWYVRFLGNPKYWKKNETGNWRFGERTDIQPRGYTQVHRLQVTAALTVTQQTRLVALGSLGGFGEDGKREGENNSAGSVRPPVYGLGWGWGLSQYGKMAWSLFLLVNSYQTVDSFTTISSRRAMLESFETMLTAAVRYFQPLRCQRSWCLLLILLIPHVFNYCHLHWSTAEPALDQREISSLWSCCYHFTS